MSFSSNSSASQGARRRAAGWLCMALLAAMLGQWPTKVSAQSAEPRAVSFPSADGKTMLTGYLFAPAGRPKTAPAVVMLHGRGGAYSPHAKGNYSAMTLDKGLREWAELWSTQGYWALVVDSFSARGLPAGLPSQGTDAGRAAAATEAALRPLDAYGALHYLRASPRVKPDRIALEGWSNGGSAALATMDRSRLPTAEGGHGFRAALAFDPSCPATDSAYHPYAPVRIFVGGHDNGPGVAACQKLASLDKNGGSDVAVTVFQTASREFDDPMRRRQDIDADEDATAAARRDATALLASLLGH